MGMCGNLVNALKLPLDSPVNVVVQGPSEKGRLGLMDELRRFITVTNHEALRAGELEENMESRQVVKPKFTTDVPEAVVREGADELMLRREEGVFRTFIGITSVGDSGGHHPRTKAGMPLVNPFSKVSWRP